MHCSLFINILDFDPLDAKNCTISPPPVVAVKKISSNTVKCPQRNKSAPFEKTTILDARDTKIVKVPANVKQTIKYLISKLRNMIRWRSKNWDLKKKRASENQEKRLNHLFKLYKIKESAMAEILRNTAKKRLLRVIPNPFFHFPMVTRFELCTCLSCQRPHFPASLVVTWPYHEAQHLG